MAISTNGTVIARLAGGLYNTVLSNATYLEVAAQDPSALANTLYSRDFAKTTDLAVATTLITNLGLTTVAGLDNWVAAQLTAAGAAGKGAKIVSMLNDFAGMTADATYGAAATAFNTKVDAALAASQKDAAVSGVFATAGTVAVANATFTLTTGADIKVGGAGDDTFLASESSSTAAFWTVGDSIDGGLGNDTLNIVQTAAIAAALPVGASVTNVETVNFTSGGAITANVTTFTGLTKATATNSGANDVTLTGAATTDLTVTNATLAAGIVTVNGGKDVSITTGELTASAGTGGAISVGTSTAAAGKVAVTQSLTSGNVTTATTATGGAITVKGGTSINVNQTIAPTAAAAATVLTGSVTVTNTGGAITVTGDASTTDVTVTQSAKVTAVSSSTIGRVGIIDGAVDVLDVNRASTTTAGKISTVSITNAGAATVNSGALTTLNIGGSLVTVDAGTLGALTTPANTTLALNLTGAVSTGAVTVDSDITTLNISGNTTSSTIASLVASGATAINVAGDAKVTLTANTTAAVKTITVTNTAGAKFGTAIATGVTFTGGDGADKVKLTTGFTKAITMGAGDDTVVYGGPASTTTGAKGSVDAGAGTDVIQMTDADADSIDGSSVFNTAFKGFETLEITDAFTTDSLDLDGVNGVTSVWLDSGVSGSAGITNLASGGTVEIDADGASTPVLTVAVKSALVGSADVLNLEMYNTAAQSTGTVVAANVETININAPDASATGSSAAVQHSLTLQATSATAVKVSGNNGLALTNTGNTKITSFDASGVVGNSTVASTYKAAVTDLAADLAVSFTSANTTATAVVTITGGAGNDTLTGNASKDTISGGAGIDAIDGKAGIDTLTGGAGIDVFTIGAGEAGITGAERITDFAVGVKGDNLNLSTTTLVANVTASDVTSVISGAVDVTATVKSGILTIGGADAALVDSLAEFKAVFEAIEDAGAADVAAFVFGGNTYVITDTLGGSANDIVQLTGVVTATSLATASAEGTILIS